MTMATTMFLYFSFSLLILTPTVFSQKYSFQNKDYFLTKETKTFDEAIALCSSRGERLVEIKSAAENEYIFNKIVGPANWHTWLAATNIRGTNQFKWLSDGSDVNAQYSNWSPQKLKKDVNQRNAIAMYKGNGQWFDDSITYTRYVLCEQDSVPDPQSQLTEFKAKISKLEAQANDMSTEVEFQKQFINRLNIEVSKQNQQLESRLNSNEIECSEKIARLEGRINRLEQKMSISNNILDNSNKI